MAGVFFESLTFGIYYSIIRPYMEFLGAAYTLIFLIDLTYALVGLTSIVWGYLSDVYGRDKPIYAGILGFIPLLLLSSITDPIEIIIVSTIFFTFYIMAQPAILALTSQCTSIGRGFAYYTIASSLGWGVGGVVMGLIHDTLGFGVRGVFIVSAVSWIISFSLFTISIRGLKVPSGNAKLKLTIPKNIRLLFIVQLLAFAGINWFFPLAALKVHEMLGGDKLLYGIIWGFLPTITSLIVSPFVGKLADLHGGVKMYFIALASYTFLLPLLAYTQGLLFIILWLVPLWPFYHIGVNSAASQLSNIHERGEALGAITTATNVSIILAFLGGIFADILGRETSMVLSAIPLMISTLIAYFRLLKVESGGLLEK